MKTYIISADLVVANWAFISSQLDKARQTGQNESSLTDYLRKILNNQAFCWIVEDDTGKITGVGLTEFVQYSQHKTLHIIAFSGEDFENQAKVFPTIVQFAKDAGCTSIEQYGRKGWAKVLPKYIPEFKEVYTVMRYDL